MLCGDDAVLRARCHRDAVEHHVVARDHGVRDVHIEAVEAFDLDHDKLRDLTVVNPLQSELRERLVFHLVARAARHLLTAVAVAALFGGG